MNIWGRAREYAMRDTEVVPRRRGIEHAIVEILVGLMIAGIGVLVLDYSAPNLGDIMFCLLGVAIITKGIVDFPR